MKTETPKIQVLSSKIQEQTPQTQVQTVKYKSRNLDGPRSSPLPARCTARGLLRLRCSSAQSYTPVLLTCSSSTPVILFIHSIQTVHRRHGSCRPCHVTASHSYLKQYFNAMFTCNSTTSPPTHDHLWIHQTLPPDPFTSHSQESRPTSLHMQDSRSSSWWAC